MKPMCAFRYQDHQSSIVYPMYVQPKFNGIRMLTRNVYDTHVTMQSRDEHRWRPEMLIEIQKVIAQLTPKVLLDGELYKHGWSLQQINGACSVNRLAPTPKTSEVAYHVFDCVFIDEPMLPFTERWTRLAFLLSPHVGPHLALSPTYFAPNAPSAESYFAQFKREGYEGMMYRDVNAPYGFSEQCGNQENRWKRLLKRKDWLDAEFEIIDIESGEGKYAQCVGSLVFRMPSGVTFSAGSGLSDMQRQDFFDNPPIGQYAKIKYEMLSDGGVPLKPTIEAVFGPDEPVH